MNDKQRYTGCSGQRGSRDLGELANGDYLAFSALIWRKEVHMPHFVIPGWL